MTSDERDRGFHDRDLADLQSLDPARPSRPGAGSEPAAQALLGRILDEPRGSASRGEERSGDRRRWRARALVAAVAAAVAAGLVVVPPWGTPESAFASWTPGAEEVPAGNLDDVGTQCTQGSGGSDLWEQDAVIAEERGRVTFVVALTPTSLWHCLLVDGEFHSSGRASVRDRPVAVPSTDVRTSMVGGGGHAEEAYTAITGQVGDDVIGIEVHPRGHVTEPGALPDGEPPDAVTATIDNGHFGAWWPGGTDRVELTLHLADGTVVPNVPAFEHDR